MKSFFDSLLDNRHYEECPLPLWKLKITDEEYKALKEFLEQRTYEGHPFKKFRKESVLFFAEYWRREYKNGKHSTKMVYDALESTMKSEDFSEDFYKQAIEGAKFLGIELYAGGRIDYLDSMLYQGGLPMSLVSQNDTDSVWGRFMRGLVNKRYNFDELDLGVVATKSQSLKEYCRQMMVAIEKDEYKLMPFYCSNESDNWYISILDLSKREKIRQSHLHPFSLDWEFRVDSRERIIKTNYIIKGFRELPSAFLEEEGLSNTPSFSVLIKINGRPADSFLYQDSYCRDNVLSEKSYKFGDIVSLTIHDNDEPYITDSLDMSIPHILYKDNDGIYKLGNHIRENVSLLLFDETWKVQNENQYQIDTFKWGNVNLKGIEIEDKFDGTITLSGPDGQISFGENSPMYWTEINSNQMPTPDIEGSFYNADTCKFKLCYDTEDGVKSSNNVPVEFRSRYQDNWSDTASIGQIFVRAKSQDNRFVTPIQIVNIGTAPVINIENADQDTCDIRVSWNCGKVKTKEGTLKCDVWHIRKEDCQNPNKISFDFIPEQNSRNQFSVSVKAPFKEFAILDTDEKAISSNVWIPYIDLDKYQYHLVGQDVTYTLGEIKRKLSWYENK